MSLIRLFFLFAIVGINLGCSETTDSSDAERYRMSEPASLAAPKFQQTRGEYLAYEHSLTVELAEAKMQSAFDALLKQCQQSKSACTMMQSELSSGTYARGHLRFRVTPESVDDLLKLAQSFGDVTTQSTNVDDLQDAIVDGGKRIELLEAYQQRLLLLEAQASKDIESLIKVASELSRVQSDLEYALGEKSRLLQRVNQDIVNIALTQITNKGFWAPIFDSFDDFGENFSDAIASMVTALAYIFPWLIVLVLFLFFARALWRLAKRK